MERKEGYYWVLWLGDWTIAEWDAYKKAFHLTGLQDALKEDKFEKILPNPIPFPEHQKSWLSVFKKLKKHRHTIPVLLQKMLKEEYNPPTKKVK